MLFTKMILFNMFTLLDYVKIPIEHFVEYRYDIPTIFIVFC